MNHEEMARTLPEEVLIKEIERRENEKKAEKLLVLFSNNGKEAFAIERRGSACLSHFWIGPYEPEGCVTGRTFSNSAMIELHFWLSKFFPGWLADLRDIDWELIDSATTFRYHSDLRRRHIEELRKLAVQVRSAMPKGGE